MKGHSITSAECALVGDGRNDVHLAKEVGLSIAFNAASERGFNIIEPIDAVASEDFEKHYMYVHNHGIFKTQLTTTKKILEKL